MKGKEKGTTSQESHRTFPKHSTETQQHYLIRSLTHSANVSQEHLPCAGNQGVEKNVTMAGLKKLSSYWGDGRVSHSFPCLTPSNSHFNILSAPRFFSSPSCLLVPFCPVLLLQGPNWTLPKENSSNRHPSDGSAGEQSQPHMVTPSPLCKLDLWHSCWFLKAEPLTLGTRRITARLSPFQLTSTSILWPRPPCFPRKLVEAYSQYEAPLQKPVCK